MARLLHRRLLPKVRSSLCVVNSDRIFELATASLRVDGERNTLESDVDTSEQKSELSAATVNYELAMLMMNINTVVRVQIQRCIASILALCACGCCAIYVSYMFKLHMRVRFVHWYASCM